MQWSTEAMRGLTTADVIIGTHQPDDPHPLELMVLKSRVDPTPVAFDFATFEIGEDNR